MTRLSGEKAKAKAKSKPSDAADVGLNVAATVLKTLQAVAGASPVPGLAQAASLALEITTMAQTAKGNKVGFGGLADASRELVYVIFCANRNVEKAEDVPPGLAEQLDRVLSVLLEVKAFAEKGSSRNRFSAFVRAGVDSGQIQEHRQKLQQCLGTFGFQTDISLQVMVHKLVAHHGKMLDLLENKDKPEPNGQSNGSSPDPNPTPGPGPSAKRASGFDFSGAGGSPNPWAGMKINRTVGDVEMNHVYNVTNNSDSNNTYTNSNVNKNNTSTVNSNYNRGGDTVTNDYSVNMGENVNFAGAYGINFGSNNVNNMGRSS